MDIINSNKIHKLSNKNIFNKVFHQDLINHRNLSSNSKSVHLILNPKQENLLNKFQYINNPVGSKSEISINLKKNFSTFKQTNNNISSQSSNLNCKSHSNSELISQRNYVQLCSNNIKTDLINNLIRKNAINSITNINEISKSHFHSAPILKDQDDDMPKFRDSREKKEYIKLATKRNDIAARGRMEGSYHWALSKIVIAGILGCVVASGIVGHHMFIDVLLGVLLPMHVFYTFQDLVYDYIPTRRYPRAHKFLIWIIRIVTVISLFSMFKFNTEDIGISDAAKQAWSAAKTHKPDEEIKDEDIFYDTN